MVFKFHVFRDEHPFFWWNIKHVVYPEEHFSKGIFYTRYLVVSDWNNYEIILKHHGMKQNTQWLLNRHILITMKYWVH